MKTSTLSSKGQVTIPKRIRDKLGIKPGDSIAFIENDEEILVKKEVKSPVFDRYVGLLDTGKTTDEIISELRGD